MNTAALLLFAVWALFIRLLPNFLNFLRIYRFSKTIPGPTIGEFMEAVKRGKILAWLRSLCDKHGAVFRVWFGKNLFVFFSDAEDVRQLLNSNLLLYKSPNYEMVQVWLGRGLLTNGGDDWHRRRKLLTPAFHFKILSEFKEPIEENCQILLAKLNNKADGEAFDIYPYITLFALDAICETAMGIKRHAQMQSDSEYVRAVQNICRILHKRSFSFWQRINIFFPWTQMGKELTEALKTLHGETNRVIKLRREILEKSQIRTGAEAHTETGVEPMEDAGGKRRFAFLDMLLISQRENGDLTDIEIREEVDTFLFEGHDTTSSAIAFALYLLSTHSEVQQRAHEEAITLKGNEKEPMRYLEAIIKETLRLYPSVPFYSRKVIKETQIGNITIPAGVSVSTLAYAVHRDKTQFPQPDKFDPERFLAAQKDLHPFAFVTFSAGPRNCIGQKFAMLEMKTTLASLLRHFELLPVAGFEPEALAELVMKSSNGIQVRLRRRQLKI